jgi:hypothetical protein
MPPETPDRQPDRLEQEADAAAEQSYEAAVAGRGEWQMTLKEATALSGFSRQMLKWYLRHGQLEATLITAKRPYYLINVQSLVDLARTKKPTRTKRTGRPPRNTIPQA